MFREKELMAVAVFGLLLTILSISALAIPCNWYGLVTVNGNNASSINVTAYNNETIEYIGSGYAAVPDGQYFVRINDTFNVSYAYFRISGLLANEGPQLWESGGSKKLNLTATDGDNDGYSMMEDCNDTNPSINPGALEDCDNGIDDDCDGLIDINDTDCQACVDSDGDGYGFSGINCTYPETDCDDSNPGANPGATESCNGIDDDCDGLIDNVQGTSQSITGQCGSSNVGECSYGTKTCAGGDWGSCVGNVEPVNEVCHDGKDNNCNGAVDEYCGGGGGGGTSSGGGSYTCTPKWSCTEWSACPPDGIQTRSCTDSNGCGTSSGKPEETQSCTYMPPYQPCNNNGDCGPGETPENCPNDCKPPQVCVPGVRACEGDDLMQCSSDGMGWEKTETCEYGCSGEECLLAQEEEGGAPEERGPSVTGGGITGFIVSNPVPFAALIVVIVAVIGYVIYRNRGKSQKAPLSKKFSYKHKIPLK